MAQRIPLRSASEAVICSRCGTDLIRVTVDAPMPILQVADVLQRIMAVVFTVTPMCDPCLLDLQAENEQAENG